MTRNCSADYTHVINFVDSMLANGTTAQKHELKLALYTVFQSGPDGRKPPSIKQTEAEAMSNPKVGYDVLLPLSCC